MPDYLRDIEIWKVIWPVPLVALSFSLVLLIFIKLFKKSETDMRDVFWALYAFSLFGIVIGILTGYSRQPVVGALIPAISSLVGGITIYLIGKDTHNRMIVSLCVIALSFNLLIGALGGG